MRKISIILLALFIAGAAFAQETKLSVGGGIGIEGHNLTTTFDALGIHSTDSRNSAFINFGAFLDATYLVLSAKYGLQLGNTQEIYRNTPFDFLNSSGEITENSGNLELSVAGKLPIQVVEGFVLFPLVGVEYDINLTYQNKDSFSDEQKKDLNDFFLLLGLGADIYATPTVYFRPQLNFGVNLTASPTSTAADTTYTGYKFGGGIGIGFTF